MKQRIVKLVFQFCLKDVNLLYVLQQDDYKINVFEFVRLRKKMNIKRKVSVFHREKIDAELRALIITFSENFFVIKLKRNMLYTHFRTQDCLIYF